MLTRNMSDPSSQNEPRRGLNLAGLVGLTFFCVAGGAYQPVVKVENKVGDPW